MQNLQNFSGNPFSGMPLDRVDHLRNDESWLQKQLNDPSTQVISVWNQESIIVSDSKPYAALASKEEIFGLFSKYGGKPEFCGFLGLTREQKSIAYFVVDVSHLSQEEVLACYQLGTFMDLRQSVQLVPGEDAAILAYARALIYWQRSNKFCATCGHLNILRKGGHELRCTNKNCGVAHFPRTDAAVIALVYDKNDCLLCRQSHWPTGMHSTLAGFLEPGESLEESVAREIFEESGVCISDITYHSSQPWAFPSSLMVGFMARATSRVINVDNNELEYANWYSREWLKNIEDSDIFRLPGEYSIARRLIEDWIDQKIPFS